MSSVAFKSCYADIGYIEYCVQVMFGENGAGGFIKRFDNPEDFPPAD